MSGPSLRNSKYAPKTPLETLVRSKAEKLKKEKERATRLLVRLQWKAELLAASYQQAISIVNNEAEQNGGIDARTERNPFGAKSVRHISRPA
jgi:hypothetical protein